MTFTAQVKCDGTGCNEMVEFQDDSFLVHDLRTDLKQSGWLINRLTSQDFCPKCAAPFRNAIKQSIPLEVRHCHHQESRFKSNTWPVGSSHQHHSQAIAAAKHQLG